MTRRAAHEVDPATLEVWARRAAELAKVPPAKAEGEHALLVAVRIGRELYAFDARYVFDIRPVRVLARVPHVPAWVAGVTSVRGRILSVFDLGVYFGLTAAEPEAEWGTQHLVLVETPDMELCLLVDEVVAVTPLALGSLKEVGVSLQGLPPEYVRGIVSASAAGGVRWGDGLIVVLDLPALLADRHIVVNQEAI